jgi:FK506-binding nuclear protein
MPDDDGHNHHHEVYDSSDDEDEDYDLSPDEDELELDIDEDESDELDGLENPRITEVDSDEEEVPKLVAKAEKKGKNKRSADEIDEGASLDDIMAKSLKAEGVEEPKLTKKQKKQKKNNGEAALASTPDSKGGEAKEVSSAKSDKSDKKVQFAKNLEQGPTGSEAPAKGNKTTLGVKTVNGVKIDDKKLGTGPAVKNGDKVGVRYIGKLLDGKVFDCKLLPHYESFFLSNILVLTEPKQTRVASLSSSRLARKRSSQAGILALLACRLAESDD